MNKANPTIEIIGFNVGGRARTQLRCLAAVSRGRYSDVKTVQDLSIILKRFFIRMREFYTAQLCINRDFNRYLACETNKYDKAHAWINQKKLLEKNQQRLEALIKAEKKIDHRYFNEVRNLSQKALNAKIIILLKEINSALKNAE